MLVLRGEKKVPFEEPLREPVTSSASVLSGLNLPAAQKNTIIQKIESSLSSLRNGEVLLLRDTNPSPYQIERGVNAIKAFERDIFYERSFEIRKVFGSWHVTGSVSGYRRPPEDPQGLRQWNEIKESLRGKIIYKLNVFEHDQAGVLDDVSESTRRTAILKSGTNIKLNGKTIRLPEIDFDSPFSADTKGPQLATSTGLFGRLSDFVSNFLYPEVIGQKEVSKLKADGRDSDSNYPGVFNKYYAVFSEISRLYESATGKKLEFIDADWIREKTGLQIFTPVISTRKIQLERHRINAAINCGMKIRVSYIDESSIN